MMLRLLSGAMIVDACSRLVYDSVDGYFTARSLDWFEDPQSDLWAFPAGMKKDGGMGEGSIEWESKYGSVMATSYALAGLDGINTEGLVANMLYLTETDTGADNPERAGQPKLSIGGWLSYFLDNFASVAEAVDALKDDQIRIMTPPLPMGKAATTHVSLSDETGDNAVFEFLDGKLEIHHSKEYTVMTNSPKFDHQLAIANYFELIGGLNFLPGTHTAADRFVRLNYNVNAVPKFEDREIALATAMSLIRHISVPFGITDPVYPNLASTYSRQVYDHTERIMFFENALSPNTFWVNLRRMDLSKGSGVRKLSYMGRWLAGEQSAAFVPAEPFEFLGPQHTDGSVTLPEYGSEPVSCVFKNMRLGPKQGWGWVMSSSKEDSAEFCNEKCKGEGADAFQYEPPTLINPKSKKCKCLHVKKFDPENPKKHKLVLTTGKITARVMEYFSDAPCAGMTLY